MGAPFPAEADVVDDADAMDGTGRGVTTDGRGATDVVDGRGSRSVGRTGPGDVDECDGAEASTGTADAAVAGVATAAAERAQSRLAARGDVTVEQERAVDDLARAMAARLVTEFVEPIERLERDSKATASDDPGDRP